MKYKNNKIANAYISGQSGDRYCTGFFALHKWPSQIYPSGIWRPGVYLIVRYIMPLECGGSDYDVVYVGTTDNLMFTPMEHPLYPRWRRWEGNVIAIHPEENKARRIEIAKDLIDEHQPWVNREFAGFDDSGTIGSVQTSLSARWPSLLPASDMMRSAEQCYPLAQAA